MVFRIDTKIFASFPALRIGVIAAHGLDNTGQNDQISSLLLDSCVKTADFFGGDPVASHPTIAEWRRAYKQFGCKDLRSSIESLAKRAAQKKTLPQINKLVDLYNHISLKYMLPVGGEDLDKIEGDLCLTFAIGEERFVPLLETENNPPKSGEVIYTDDAEVICRAWNWRECDKTKLTEETKNAVFVIESLLPEETDRLAGALDEMSVLLTKYCGAQCETATLDRTSPAIFL